MRGFARQMRHEPSDAEARLWRALRDRRLAGFKFRRQHPLAGYVLDFYCPTVRLAVELDGGQHGEDAQRSYDAARSETLEKPGIRVLRFWNDVVLRQPEDVLEQIDQTLRDSPSPRPSPPAGERGGLHRRRSHA